MIKLKDILLEGLSKNKVQAIVDKVFPQIVQEQLELAILPCAKGTRLKQG